MRFHFLLLVFNRRDLSDHYLRFGSDDARADVGAPNEGLEFVFYATLGVVVAGLVLSQRRDTMKEAG